jgi:hypothetical protein
MTQHLSPTESCLRELLADGPRLSREVLASMAARGITPKQVRRARELLGVVTQRAGSGTSMHSVWSLPPSKPNIGTSGVEEIRSVPRVREGIRAPVEAPVEMLKNVKVCQAVSVETKMETAAAFSALLTAVDLTVSEQHRHQVRIEAFRARGLDDLTASQVADALVGRDRAGLRATGSCAECQCIQLRTCPTSPRPVIEIHECWYRRKRPVNPS